MTKISGIDPGQRQLNGPQTSGRHTQPVAADVRGNLRRRRRVRCATASSCSRTCTVQANPGATRAHRGLTYLAKFRIRRAARFRGGGRERFFRACGYVHVIANCRGTSGSGGTFGFFDGKSAATCMT